MKYSIKESDELNETVNSNQQLIANVSYADGYCTMDFIATESFRISFTQLYHLVISGNKNGHQYRQHIVVAQNRESIEKKMSEIKEAMGTFKSECSLSPKTKSAALFVDYENFANELYMSLVSVMAQLDVIFAKFLGENRIKETRLRATQNLWKVLRDFNLIDIKLRFNLD